MPFALLLCLTVAKAAVGASTLSRVSLEKYPRAVCMDGSPGAYYFLQNPDSPVLHISMEGGGSCVDKQTCDLRCTGAGKGSRYCSSTNMPATMDIPYGGLLGRDCSKSPDFCNASFAWVRYCTADWYAGSRDASLDTFGYNFHGRDVMDAVLQDLASSMSPAVKRVLFSGASGGGEGVTHNCDRAAAAFDPLGIQVHCLIDAAWDNWYSAATGSNCTKTRQHSGQLGKSLWNATFNERCEAALGPQDSWMCFSGPKLFTYLSTPLFVSQAFFDPVQLKQECWAESGLPLNSTWVQGFAKSLTKEIETLAANMKVHPFGTWGSSCTVHTQMGDEDGAFQRKVADITLQAAVSRWWKGESVSFIEHCSGGGPCNPDSHCLQTPPAGCTDCTSCMANLCSGLRSRACHTCALQHKAALQESGCTEDKLSKICYGVSAGIDSEPSVTLRKFSPEFIGVASSAFVL